MRWSFDTLYVLLRFRNRPASIIINDQPLGSKPLPEDLSRGATCISVFEGRWPLQEISEQVNSVDEEASTNEAGRVLWDLKKCSCKQLQRAKNSVVHAFFVAGVKNTASDGWLKGNEVEVLEFMVWVRAASDNFFCFTLVVALSKLLTGGGGDITFAFAFLTDREGVLELSLAERLNPIPFSWVDISEFFDERSSADTQNSEIVGNIVSWINYLSSCSLSRSSSWSNVADWESTDPLQNHPMRRLQ
jgi:hypothetical protein